jgi:hypothetical protein
LDQLIFGFLDPDIYIFYFYLYIFFSRIRILPILQNIMLKN